MAQLTACEEASKEKDKVIKAQQGTIDDVDKLIEAEKSKAAKEKFWLRFEFGAYGSILGAILAAILLF